MRCYFLDLVDQEMTIGQLEHGICQFTHFGVNNYDDQGQLTLF